MSDRTDLKPETLAAHGLYPGDPATGGVVPPIQPSTTFRRDEHYRLTLKDQGYARDRNPTFQLAERLLARLEGAAEALTFSSGMAAGVAVVQSLRPGDHIVAPKVMFWGLRNWLIAFCRDWGLGLTLFDAGEPGALEAALRPGETKLLWIESPCNPTWEVIDIAAAAKAARAAGARLAVDSTVATPVLTRPLALGADIVFHSATKYLNGHGDVVAGALATARTDEFWARIRRHREETGAILGPFEAWLLQRGLRTLYLRVRRCSDSAMAIARALEGHGKLRAVLYPGLASHPGHAVAARQMDGGFGGMLSLRVDGDAKRALQVALGCKLIVRATSLGGVESLIEHRATIEGPDSPIPQDLLRLSIGIEHPDDLIADLEQALAGA
jgi:cystathionine gamma-synthase